MPTMTHDPMIEFLAGAIAKAATYRDALDLASGWRPRIVKQMSAYLEATGRRPVTEDAAGIVRAIVGRSRADIEKEAAAVRSGVRQGGEKRLRELRTEWEKALP